MGVREVKDEYVCSWSEIFQQTTLLFPDPKPHIRPVLVSHRHLKQPTDKKKWFVLAHDVSPWSLSSVTFGSVVRQYNTADNSLWGHRSPHGLQEAEKETGKGYVPIVPLRAAPMTSYLPPPIITKAGDQALKFRSKL